MNESKKSNANKLNAKHSTGPKSKLGKLKSSKNAIKYGLYAVDTYIPGEGKELYTSIKAEQQKRFSPSSYVEKALVDQLVAELWRLRRISRAEYLLAVEIQARNKEQKIEYTPEEKNLKAMMDREPEKLAERFEYYRNHGRHHLEKSRLDLIVGTQLRILEGLERKIGEIDSTYNEMFLSEQSEKMQRLIGMKRQALQTILSIERELDSRRSMRRDANPKV